MRYLHVRQMQRMIAHATDEISRMEPYLTDIDTKIGDGDHGSGMKRGFSSVSRMLVAFPTQYFDNLMYNTGLELIKTMGGASGIIFGTMFTGGVSELPHADRASANQLCNYFLHGEKEIERRGKSSPGQKTMLDALYPACEAMQKYICEHDDMTGFFRAASDAAYNGAYNSRYLRSRSGRSRNFDHVSADVPDPGAVSVSIIFRAFYEEYRHESCTRG